jgi:putative membrane protein
MTAAPLAVSTEDSAAVQLAALAIAGVIYAHRAHRLASPEDRPERWRRACFYTGLMVIAVALVPLGAPGRDLQWVDTIEHLLLGDIAPLLIVLGLTAPLLAPVLRNRVLGRLSALAYPPVAFALWTVDLYAWHLRIFYEAGVRHSGVQFLEHALLIGFGVNMWMCLFGPLPTPSWFGNRGKLLYILAVRVAGAVLGNLLLWSGTIFYPYYLRGEAHFHLSPLADQNIAGAIITAEASILTLCLFYWLFRRATMEGRGHQAQRAQASPWKLEASPARPPRGLTATELRRTEGHRQVRAAEHLEARSGSSEHG